MNKLIKILSIIMLVFLIVCQYTVVSNADSEITIEERKPEEQETNEEIEETDENDEITEDNVEENTQENVEENEEENLIETEENNEDAEENKEETEETAKATEEKSTKSAKVISASAVATDSTTFTTSVLLKSDKDKIAPGDQLKLYIYLDKIGLAGGVSVVEGQLEWDREVMEPVLTNGAKYNDWTIAWNQANGKFEIDRIDATKDKQNVAEITFKVLDTVDATKVNNATIKSTGVTINNEVDLDVSDDSEVKFNVTAKSDETKEDEKDTTKEDEKTDEENTKDSEKSSKDNKAKVDTVVKVGEDTKAKSSGDSTQKTGSIPYTGVAGWITVAVIAIGVIGYVSYRKYQKYKNV